ncbi:rhamnogalacturonan acetylesterase [Clostridium felsineum]|uniref:rhamnogalacturonan acetylesterase n=1 Tax=Clostridium felsineum TaxID=36839 RepID=UPI00098BFC97|nr:rhamnogalacturonan acetylesterase [Clostridium felsineum]URZ00411.1 Rhamnogalacturonan acetylesterase RhgT [Clostridium felsineum]
MIKSLKLLLSSIVIVTTIGAFSQSTVSAKNVSNTNKKPITVYIAGDSTVSNYTSDVAPRAGWGQVVGQYFSKYVTVDNCAISGRSSKSFIDEGHLNEILSKIKPNDYLLIQFGHNDEKIQDPTRYTDPDTTYKSYLKQYIDGARSHHATPVLITPVSRRSFDANGKITPSHGKYPSAMIDLAKEENVTVIDLTSVSAAYFENLGPLKTENIFLHLKPDENPNYPNGVSDDTHFQERGAKKVAKLVLKELKKSNCPLKYYIK